MKNSLESQSYIYILKPIKHNIYLFKVDRILKKFITNRYIHRVMKGYNIRLYILCVMLCGNIIYNMKAQPLNFLEINPQYKPYMEHAVLQNYMEDSVTLKQVKHKWNRRKDLRIRVFGDSHVASDFITNEWRNILGNINAVGFTYPLMPPYHQTLLLEYQNNGFLVFDSRKPNDYTDYPMGGIIAYPKALPASINLHINPKQIRAWNNIFITQIVFKNSDTQAALRIEDAESKKYTLYANANDTWEIASLKLKFPITIHALNQDAKLGGYFIYKEHESNIIEHLGVNGVRSDIWTKWNKKILEKELQLLDYDIILLCYGSNDAVYNILKEERFIANYREFIAMLKQNNPNAIIILMSPPPVLLPIDTSKKKYKTTQTFLPVKEAIAKVAKMEHIMLFDIDEFIKKNGTKSAWIEHNLSKKDVHLTPQGYKLIAHGIYQALTDILNTY